MSLDENSPLPHLQIYWKYEWYTHVHLTAKWKSLVHSSRPELFVEIWKIIQWNTAYVVK